MKLRVASGLYATILTVSVLLVLAGCRSEPEATDPDDPGPIPVDKTFGESVDPDAAVDVASIAERPTAYDGESVTTRGRIAQVCQKKGCWMAMDAGDKPPVRVFVPHRDSGGYAFTLPTEATGTAVVKGTVRVHTLPERERDHYEADGAPRPDSVEVQIAARGIALTDR
ncbi:DUF4920 domain-containing protein [Longibacter salinarum]|nr:DUF4920 domain-containing protein [Longibacter salinarum]